MEHYQETTSHKTNPSKFFKSAIVNVLSLTAKRIKLFLERNANENTIYQNLQGTAKAVLRRKFIAITALWHSMLSRHLRC